MAKIQTPSFIKDTFKKIRKDFGIKAYVSKKRDLEKEDMSVCSRPYGKDYFVDFPRKADGWGKFVYDLLIEMGAETQGFKVVWDGDNNKAIKLENMQ